MGTNPGGPQTLSLSQMVKFVRINGYWSKLATKGLHEAIQQAAKVCTERNGQVRYRRSYTNGRGVDRGRAVRIGGEEGGIVMKETVDRCFRQGAGRRNHPLPPYQGKKT